MIEGLETRTVGCRNYWNQEVAIEVRKREGQGKEGTVIIWEV